MTSAVFTSTRTGVRAGMWSSLAVTAVVPRYRTSHHHWWPITCTVSLVVVLAGACVVLITNRSETTKSVEMTAIGITMPSTTTAYQLRFSPGLSPSTSRPKPRRLRRFHDHSSSPTTSPSPTQAPPIIHQKRVAMSRAWWLSGARAFCEPPHPASGTTARTRNARQRRSSRGAFTLVGGYPLWQRVIAGGG